MQQLVISYGGGGECSSHRNFFSLSNSIYELFLGRSMNIFEFWIFPCENIFWVLRPPPCPPHKFSNGPSLAWIYSPLSWCHQKINLRNINYTECLLSRGFTAATLLYLCKLSVRIRGSPFCDRAHVCAPRCKVSLNMASPYKCYINRQGSYSPTALGRAGLRSVSTFLGCNLGLKMTEIFAPFIVFFIV